MARHSFLTNLASLEDEYCRLEAENLDLRKLLVGPISHQETKLPTSQTGEISAGEVSCDFEADLPVQIFQRNGVHQMIPPRVSAFRKSWIKPDLERGYSSDTMRSRRRKSHMSIQDQVFAFMGYPDKDADEDEEQDDEDWQTRNFRRAHKSLFPDAEDMKERVRRQVMKRKYEVSDFYKETGWMQKIATHPAFEVLTLIIIGLNAVWIAIDTDYNDSALLINAGTVFQILENLFCAYFFLEISVRFSAFQTKKNCCRDFWFTFDFFLVFLMVLETWVITLILSLTTGASNREDINLSNVSVLRMARILRLTRMVRLTRLLRVMPELMILVKGMVAAARSVFFTLLLLLVLLYVFAIAFTQLLKKTDAGKQYFPNVGHSMNTLWLYATLLEEITTLTHDLEKESLWIVALLDLFILVASLTVMNMLIGVLCEVVSAVASAEKEEGAFMLVKSKVSKIFLSLGLDEDRNGLISRSEFVKIVENRDAAIAMTELGVDVVQLVDMADLFFQSDHDHEDYEKELSFTDFMDMVVQLRSKNVATVKDIMQLRKFIRLEIDRGSQEARRGAVSTRTTCAPCPLDCDVSRGRSLVRVKEAKPHPSPRGLFQVETNLREVSSKSDVIHNPSFVIPTSHVHGDSHSIPDHFLLNGPDMVVEEFEC